MDNIQKNPNVPNVPRINKDALESIIFEWALWHHPTMTTYQHDVLVETILKHPEMIQERREHMRHRCIPRDY